MNYQRVQKLPKKVQTWVNKQTSAKPQIRANVNVNYESQKYLDIFAIRKHNAKVANKKTTQRMDKEDRA